MREHVHRTIWLAILISTFVYIIVLLTAVPHTPRGPVAALETDPGAIAVIVIAAALFATAFWAGAIIRPRDADRAFFVTLALLDSVCVVGLVGAFRAGDWRIFVLPWLLSIVGLIGVYPRR
jgi:amino acid permease